MVNKGQKKFIFSIDRDILLLGTSLNVNPWQLGQEKWEEVATSLSEKYGCHVSSRTVKDRVSSLLKKKAKEELTTKTGTEEQQTERGKLLDEILAIQEAESKPVSDELGASEVNIVLNRKQEKVIADKERDAVLNSQDNEIPPEASARRCKRTRAAEEEEMISKKFQHDMDLEEKRFHLEEKVKLAEIDHEKQRLEIEMLREKRLSEEASQRTELLDVVKKSMEIMQKSLNK